MKNGELQLIVCSSPRLRYPRALRVNAVSAFIQLWWRRTITHSLLTHHASTHPRIHARESYGVIFAGLAPFGQVLSARLMSSNNLSGSSSTFASFLPGNEYCRT